MRVNRAVEGIRGQASALKQHTVEVPVIVNTKWLYNVILKLILQLSVKWNAEQLLVQQSTNFVVQKSVQFLRWCLSKLDKAR